MVNIGIESGLLIAWLSSYHRIHYIWDYKHGNVTGEVYAFELKYI